MGYPFISYCVAGHYFSIETSKPEATAGMLTNYIPFRVASLPDDCAPLFTLSGNHPMELHPDDTEEDAFLWNGVQYRIYPTADGGRIISMSVREKWHYLHTSPDWKVLTTDLSLADPEEKIFLDHFLVVGYGMRSAYHKTLKLHASVTELNGNALLFLGVSGTGKSTHSQLWHRYVPGCTLLNDDEPVVRIMDDGSLRVFGTPWSGKTPCYRNESARALAFVQLYQAPENHLEKLGAMEAMKSLFASSCMFRTDAENKNMVFDTVADILQYTDVYRLDCLPDRGAVALTEQLMQDLTAHGC